MKTRRSLLAVALALAALLSISFAGARAQAATVELLHARTYESTCNALSCTIFHGAVAVENLAYEKQVTIVYNTGDGIWRTAGAGYTGALGGSQEAWSFSIETSSSGQVRFAIRYDVAGQTYWDNSGGGDYWVGGASLNPILGAAALHLDRADYWNGRGGHMVHGTVALKNLGPTKTVRIVSTTDDWATVYVDQAMYMTPIDGSGGALERWEFRLLHLPPGDVGAVKFAISYDVGGVTYWDNNLGQNYSISLDGTIQ